MSGCNGNPSCSCGCCQGLAPLSPETNVPGLSAIFYRLGTYDTFLQRMLSQIQSPHSLADSPSGPWPLAALTTRSPDDPVVALLDAWAVVADVLTFYQERIANEGFLRTAVERLSILQLAREIGYELSPGVAASVYLSFTVEDVIGAGIAAPLPQSPKTPHAGTQGATTYNAGFVTVPEGTKVQSIPPQGQLPQTFETSADLEARAEWNLLLPRLTRPADLAITSDGQLYLLGVRAGFPATASTTSLSSANVYLLNPDTPALQGATVTALAVQQIFLAGTNSGIKPADRILLVGRNAAGNSLALVFVVQNVESLSTQNQTRLDFVDSPTAIPFSPFSFVAGAVPANPLLFNEQNVNTYVLQVSIDESDLQTTVRINNWDPDQLTALVNNPSSPSDPTEGMFSFAAKTGFFGHNAPLYESLPAVTSTRADAYPRNWDAFNNGAGPFVWTDSQGNLYSHASAYFERALPQIVPQNWTVFESKTVPATPYLISGVVEESLADYGMSGKCTGVALPLSDFVGGIRLGAPSAVTWNNRIDLFAVGADGNLYHKGWDGPLSGVADWENLGPPPTGGGVTYVGSPSAVTGGLNVIDIFALGSDGCLYYIGGDGTVWIVAQNLGSSPGGFATGSSVAPSAVAAASYSNNFVDGFAIGSDGNLYHVWNDGSSWGGPDSFGLSAGNLTGTPAAVAGGPNGIDVFACDSNGLLNHLSAANVSTTETLGGGLQGSPCAVSWGATRVDVFAIDTSSNLFHAYAEGVGDTTPWGTESLGGGHWAGSPTAVSTGVNLIDVYGYTDPRDLLHQWWDGATWQGPQDLGGDEDLLISQPSAVVRAGRIDVFAASFDYGIFHVQFSLFLVRSTTAYVQSQQQVFSEFPVTDDIPSGSMSLMLNGMVLGLTPGQAIAVSGTRSDAPGVSANEIILLQEIVHNGGFTTLEFTTGLVYGYQRANLTLNANTIAATQGSTIAVPEVLGSGSAAQTNQSFTLKQQPLTYVSAATLSGAESTLEVRVNNLLWQESPSLYGLGSTDQNYVVRRGDDGKSTVTFGDGVAGSRLPTGQNNVMATYRTGIGTAGNVDAGTLSILQSRPPGVRSVNNALVASGGANPEDRDHARENAPLTVLTLDRIVSLEDYEDFAGAFPGIGKAQAVPFWDGETGLVHLTISGVEGKPVDPTSQLYQSLSKTIGAACDPVQQVRISTYQAVSFNLSATVIIDEPRYVAADVLTAMETALVGAFSFDQRAFAQPVTAAEVITTMQDVPGVIAVNLIQLYRSDDPSGPSQTEPDPVLPAAYATIKNGVISAAELLLLNPLGFTVTEKKP